MRIPISSEDCSCFSYASSNSCLQTRWFAVALAISGFIFLGAAAFGGIALFALNLPHSFAHAVGTIGHTGSLAMLAWGTVLGGVCILGAILTILKICRTQELNALLLEAVRIRSTDVVITCLDQGALIEARDERGSTPLIISAANGDVETIIALLDRGANIEATSRSWTPLIWTVIYERPTAMQILLERGANIEARDHSGATALVWAARCNYIDMTNFLLDQGANVNVLDHRGLTVLDHAQNETREILLNWIFTHRSNTHRA